MWLVFTLALLLLSIGATTAVAKFQQDGGMSSEPKLLGVRFKAAAGVLSEIEKIASSAGWTEARRDEPGTMLVLAPTNYRFEDFTKLIDAIDAANVRGFELQLIGADGKAVRLDGQPISEK